MESLQVSDYMNHHPVKLTEDMTVAEAVERLLANNQTGGAVQNARGQVTGFLSEQDCLKMMIVKDSLKHESHRLLSFSRKELILYYYYNVCLISVLSYNVSQSLDHLNSDCTTKRRIAALLLISRLCCDRCSSYSIHEYLLLVVLFQQEKLVF